MLNVRVGAANGVFMITQMLLLLCYIVEATTGLPLSDTQEDESILKDLRSLADDLVQDKKLFMQYCFLMVQIEKCTCCGLQGTLKKISMFCWTDCSPLQRLNLLYIKFFFVLSVFVAAMACFLYKAASLPFGFKIEDKFFCLDMLLCL